MDLYMNRIKNQNRAIGILGICVFFTVGVMSCDIVRPISKESSVYRKKKVEEYRDDFISCIGKRRDLEIFVESKFTQKGFGVMYGDGEGYVKSPEDDVKIFTSDQALTGGEKLCISNIFAKVSFPISDRRVTYELVSFKIWISNGRAFVRYVSPYGE